MDVCHANTACTAVESCSLVCACGDDSCISDNGKAANCSVNGDVIDFKSADCSVMVTVSQPRGVGYSAHRTNAVGLTERHSRAIRDLANSHKEVEISNCCNSCVRMVHTHAPKFSDVGNLEIGLSSRASMAIGDTPEDVSSSCNHALETKAMEAVGAEMGPARLGIVAHCGLGKDAVAVDAHNVCFGAHDSAAERTEACGPRAPIGALGVTTDPGHSPMGPLGSPGRPFGVLFLRY